MNWLRRAHVPLLAVGLLSATLGAASAFADATFTTNTADFQITNATAVNVYPYTGMTPGGCGTGCVQDGNGYRMTSYPSGLTIGGVTFSDTVGGNLAAASTGYDFDIFSQGIGGGTIDGSIWGSGAGLTISFSSPVTAIGMDVSVTLNEAPIVITLSDGETFTTSAVGGQGNNGFYSYAHLTYSFVGIDSTEGISSLTLTNDSPNNGIVGNLEYGNAPRQTPEPSSLALLGTGLIGGIRAMKRKLAR